MPNVDFLLAPNAPSAEFECRIALTSSKDGTKLITADTDTQIYYVSLTGFDTHANQKNQQERLLKQYGVKGVPTVVFLDAQGHRE